jgi:hypothetical protein
MSLDGRWKETPMRRSSLIPPMAAALALAWLAVAPPAGHAADQMNVRFPISDTIFDPCTDEVVDLDGSAHVVLDVTINDNHSALTFHANSVESGVGETTGASYELPANFSDHTESSLANGQFTETTVIRNLRLLTAGGGNNFFAFDDTVHITVNATGDVSVDYDHLTPNGCG